jgi:hypothetical protein
MASSPIGFLNVINKSNKTKTYGFVAFTLLVVIILIVGALRPTVLTITRINKEIEDKRFINEQLESKLSNIGDLSVQYTDLEDDANTLPLIYPPSGNFSLFMSNVEEISKSFGYSLSGINFGDADGVETDLNALSPFSAKLTVTGKKTNLVKLLQAFESMPMYPVVNQVSYASKTNDDGLTSFSIELIVYETTDPEFYK